MPAEADSRCADLHARRLGQSQRFEELLHRPQPRGGRALHGIAPAVVAVPLLDAAVFKPRGRVLRRRASLLRQLTRGQRAGQYSSREGAHRHFQVHAHRHGAAAGIDDQPAFQGLAARAQSLPDNEDWNGRFRRALKQFLRAARRFAQDQPGHVAGRRTVRPNTNSAASVSGNAGAAKPVPMVANRAVTLVPGHQLRNFDVFDVALNRVTA